MDDIFAKFGLKEIGMAEAYTYRYVPDKNKSISIGLDITFIDGHAVIIHLDSQQNVINWPGPKIKFRFDDTGELETLLKMIYE